MRVSKLLFLFLLICGSVLASDIVTDFSENSIPVLNEELRKIKKDIPLSVTQTRIILWYIGGDIETGDGQGATVYVPFSGTLTSAKAHVDTAPTGDDIDITIMKNGADILTGSLTIAATATSGTTTAIATTSVSANDYLTLNIDTIGSTLPGTDLTVELYMTQDITL